MILLTSLTSASCWLVILHNQHRESAMVNLLGRPSRLSTWISMRQVESTRNVVPPAQASDQPGQNETVTGTLVFSASDICDCPTALTIVS